MSLTLRTIKNSTVIPDVKNIGIISRVLRLFIGVILILSVFPDFKFDNFNLAYLMILPLIAVYPTFR